MMEIMHKNNWNLFNSSFSSIHCVLAHLVYFLHAVTLKILCNDTITWNEINWGTVITFSAQGCRAVDQFRTKGRTLSEHL